MGAYRIDEFSKVQGLGFGGLRLKDAGFRVEGLGSYARRRRSVVREVERRVI